MCADEREGVGGGTPHAGGPGALSPGGYFFSKVNVEMCVLKTVLGQFLCIFLLHIVHKSENKFHRYRRKANHSDAVCLLILLYLLSL